MKKVKKFEELSKSEKRVAIAEDIISQVNLKIYKAKTGVYVEAKGVSKLKKEDSVQDALLENKLTCTVCAVGSLFCSLIKFENKLQVQELKNVVFSSYFDEDEIDGRKRLEKYFSKKQLGLIESAFEEYSSYAEHSNNNIEDIDKAHRFAERNNLTKASDILIAIMQNIIKNSGRFRP